MRIVLTVHQFLPEYSSGTEILTFNTAKELQRRGHEVVIWAASFTDKSAPVTDEYLYEGLRVCRYNYNLERAAATSGLNAIETEYNNREFGRIFGDFLDEYKPDLIHFFHLGRLSATPVLAGRERKIPMIFTATDFWFVCPTCQLILPDDTLCMGPAHHGSNCVRHLIEAFQPPQTYEKVKRLPDRLLNLACYFTTRDWWPYRKYAPLISAITRRMEFLRGIINIFDKVFVPTTLMKDMLVQHGLDQDRVVMQSFGINHAGLGIVPKKNNDRLQIGFIGTICEIKGVHILLDAIGRLPVSVPLDVKIYGSEEQFPEYVDQLRRIAGSDSRIHFLGSFPNSDIGRIFSEIDVLVVPSMWYENTPLVMHTAQATRTPIIATNLGGMSEIVEHGTNGLLFDMGDAAGLSAQIRRFLDDRHLVEKLSENARAPKTISRYADELEETYSEIICGTETSRILEFKIMGDERGLLVALEENRNIPFPIKRIFYIFGTKENVARGKHAHRNLQQVLVSVHGSCKVLVDDGTVRRVVTLDRPEKGLFIDSLVWREMFDFSEDCVLLVLANDFYNESGYIRNYDDFKQVISGPASGRDGTDKASE